ncbi:hypothetical protein [Pandoraea sputorum]|uniref:Uncharacterized protein n=1 Tax=Pandoraea sputorum TaxID=93222 RepID=A0A239SFQ1_9BURK|nr:hypothetical protein [Pandoraea sputorum]AJC16819.1 hypothetical protein NA29_13860 [Pandoraea sputorum]SNU84305.1 Uncharacterised protein [Pandoraea sputorum]VVD90049.1 hypothetical protein PSP20601_01569 [Pandoraea sputorum]
MLTTVYCQFSDATESAIVSVFACLQDPTDWPHQGEVTSDDSRYIAYFDGVGKDLQRHMLKPGE